MKKIYFLALGALISYTHAQLIVSEKFISRWTHEKIRESL